jgi:hypothetical protein
MVRELDLPQVWERLRARLGRSECGRISLLPTETWSFRARTSLILPIRTSRCPAFWNDSCESASHGSSFEVEVSSTFPPGSAKSCRPTTSIHNRRTKPPASPPFQLIWESPAASPRGQIVNFCQTTPTDRGRSPMAGQRHHNRSGKARRRPTGPIAENGTTAGGPGGGVSWRDGPPAIGRCRPMGENASGRPGSRASPGCAGFLRAAALRPLSRWGTGAPARPL